MSLQNGMRRRSRSELRPGPDPPHNITETTSHSPLSTARSCSSTSSHLATLSSTRSISRPSRVRRTWSSACEVMEEFFLLGRRGRTSRRRRRSSSLVYPPLTIGNTAALLVTHPGGDRDVMTRTPPSKARGEGARDRRRVLSERGGVSASAPSRRPRFHSPSRWDAGSRT